MNFGEVIVYLKKNPRKVFTRAEWDKEYIYLVEPDCPPQLPYITMLTAKKQLIPWVPSQADILAEDWEVWQR